MEQPVRVSLVFPRSGQQLYVLIPRYAASQMTLKDGDARLGAREREDRSGSDVGHKESRPS